MGKLKDFLELDELKLWYNKFNTLFFFGKLPSVGHIYMFFDSSKEDAAAYTAINNRNGYESEETHKYPDEYYYVIGMNPECEWASKDDILSSLCHEMIHIWQWELIDFNKYSSDYSWINGHNKSFITKMNTINLISKEDDYLTQCGIKLNITIAKFK